MKTKVLLLSIILLGLFSYSHAIKKFSSYTSTELKSVTFKVYGNCGMCKSRIEKAAKSIDGVKEVEWDKSKKLLTVKYDEKVTSLDDIRKEIASVGHDTDKVKADDKVYNKLHACCKYQRETEKTE